MSDIPGGEWTTMSLILLTLHRACFTGVTIVTICDVASSGRVVHNFNEFWLTFDWSSRHVFKVRTSLTSTVECLSLWNTQFFIVIAFLLRHCSRPASWLMILILFVGSITRNTILMFISSIYNIWWKPYLLKSPLWPQILWI